MLVSSCAPRTVKPLSFAIIIALSIGSIAEAQSGGGRYAPAPSRPAQQPAPQRYGSQGSATQGSATQSSATQRSMMHDSQNRQNANAKTAMDGYCAVCLVEMREWNQGNVNFASIYDGKKYLFPGAKQKSMFDANPSKYAPVLAGDDVVTFVQTGRRLPGLLANGISYEGRYYFFASEANKKAFLVAPTQFANADLALNGLCVVCQVDKSKTVPGNPSITSLYNGMRYQFPDANAQQKFLANPVKYSQAVNAPAPPARRSAPQGSGGSGSY